MRDVTPVCPVRPGADAWLLAAMVGVLVQEDLVHQDWLAEHTEGAEAVLPHFAELPVAAYCEKAGVSEEDVRRATRRSRGDRNEDEQQKCKRYQPSGNQLSFHHTFLLSGP